MKTIPHTLSSKRGFGLIEVIVAAVVLGFMLVGLNLLQKGNRESIIRIRARDAANAIAQEVIDSISALGAASVPKTTENIPPYNKCDKNATPDTPTGSLCRERIFKGENVGDVKVEYLVEVKVSDKDKQKAEYETAFTNSGLSHQFAKQVDVTVNWKFKNSDQSINVSAIVR